MLVKDWMSKNVITLNGNDMVLHAIKLLKEHQISMMPVMEEGKLVGIVTDRDLKRASPSYVSLLDIRQITYHLSRLEVGSIMSRYAITVPLDLETPVDNGCGGIVGLKLRHP